MIYKVLYQESIKEFPIRERTKSLYIEADSVREVRQKLKDRNYNIEFIQPLSEIHLKFEKESTNFELESI